jgi:hypothetical protein
MEREYRFWNAIWQRFFIKDERKRERQVLEKDRRKKRLSSSGRKGENV